MALDPTFLWASRLERQSSEPAELRGFDNIANALARGPQLNAPQKARHKSLRKVGGPPLERGPP